MKISQGVIFTLSLATLASFAAVMSSLPTKIETAFPIESQSNTGAFSSVLNDNLLQEKIVEDKLLESKNLSENNSPEGQNSGASSSVLGL